MAEKKVLLKDMLDRKKEITDKLSTQVRTIALGILIATWGLLTNSNPQTEILVKSFLPAFTLIDLCAVLALLFDFVQYVCSYEVVSKALKTRDTETQLGDYDDQSSSFRWANRFFILKQVSAAVAVVVFLFCLAVYFGFRMVA